MSDSGIFVIGDENAVFGFRLLGVEGWTVRSADEAHSALESSLARDDLRILLVTEEWAHAMRRDLDRLRMTLPSPLIVEIPGSRRLEARPSLRALIQQALNVRLER
jgi:V/A-type H+-transporting ATPase subunit F